ncbi:uncharacterized protein LOC132721530 [Ruditapes philippinarum]|uniref:uncharacterized protein LOC132721530 n=1 Tax=Ruditapes philippinarum TaxID=129788 RepID=UPI00295B4B8A|nr:uncharacterized protein LOC132721530 [Ruditapes philippinarum]
MEIMAKILSIFLAFLTLADYSEGLSRRKIYTLYSAKKTWNEAKAICESKQSQLLKIKSAKHYEEISYLDRMEWGNRVMNEFASSSGMWSPLHKPFWNTTWTYQDCEPYSLTVPGTSVKKCSTYQPNSIISSAPCDEEHIFICERFEGDCWFQPFYEMTTKWFEAATSVPINDPNIKAEDCALECRNLYDINTGTECWGFTFYPAVPLCTLHVNNTPTASSDYLYPENRDYGELKSTFYVRRCFEGVIDTNMYDSFYDKNAEPDTSCTETPYVFNNTVYDVCYCPVQEQPPIPEPATSEEKAKQFIKKLTIGTSSTSAAERKLTSAEDNRPSVIGMGYVGILVLTAVFGSLVLLDLNVIFARIKDFCSSSTSVQTIG